MSEQNWREDVMNAETVVTAPATKQKTGLATVALVLGILSILTVLLIINYVLALIAVILGIVFLLKKDQKKGKVKAGIGLGLAVVSIVVSTVTWVNVVNYVIKTPVTQMLEDVKVMTGGQIDPGQIVNEAINTYVADTIDAATLEQVEILLGTELSYDAITEFVGEGVSIERVQSFIGDAEIKVEEVQELATSIDVNAVLEDLGGEVTFDAIEEKVGEDFTYEDLVEYLEGFKK